MKIKVKVIPNAKKYQVIRERDLLRVKVDAPAQKVKANKRLIEILAKHFNISQSRIAIIKGEKSREKITEII